MSVAPVLFYRTSASFYHFFFFFFNDTATTEIYTLSLHDALPICCPTTARLALKKLPGVYGATVTLDDSLGVVRYDPRQVTPDQIAAHLTRLTGFGATVQGK